MLLIQFTHSIFEYQNLISGVSWVSQREAKGGAIFVTHSFTILPCRCATGYILRKQLAKGGQWPDSPPPIYVTDPNSRWAK